ncbi:MAG: cytochrome c [Bacteroidetes bacterium]|nr:cytochrome c [Bacteroidota bacterium]
MKSTFIIALLSVCSLKLFSQAPSAATGQTLFAANCTACHTVGKGRIVGPDLKGVHAKYPEPRLIKWIKSSQTLVKSGDATAVALFKEYNNIPMPDFTQLSDADIKSILAFIKKESSAGTSTASTKSVK